ncbi:MAG TPA: type IV secretory system conjugative DNA transfer family protein [Methylobacter sp.]|jgi:type IV secretion system protein VirD4
MKKIGTVLVVIALIVLFIFVCGSYIAGFFILALTKSDFSVLNVATYGNSVRTYLSLDYAIQSYKLKLIGAGVLGYLLPTIATIGGLIAYFTRDRVALHGAARFASTKEVEKSGLMGGAGKKPAILLGKYKDKFLSFPGQEFVIMAAPTRGGKGVGVVIPNCLTYIDSLVVLDIKGENFIKTSGYRKQHGQKVFVFQPFSDDVEADGSLMSRSHRWNMLSYVSRNPQLRIGDIMDIGHILFADEGNENDFFKSGARSLFLGLCLYLMETEGATVTVGEVFRYGRSNGTGKPIKEFIAGLIAERRASNNPLTDDCVNALSDVTAMPENTLGSVLAEFKVKLQPWISPIVDAATSGDDFSLAKVREERMTIYIVISPPKLPVAAALINVFFSQLVSVNTKKLPEQDPRLKYQCLLLLDEFTAIGKVQILAKAVSYIAGYNIRLLPIIQSVSQLEEVYGKETARTFVVNHAVKIVYPPRDQEDAEQCSKELGTYTKKAVSTGTSKPRGLMSKSGSTSDSQNISESSRALLLPQELKDMAREDPPRALFFYEKTRVILGYKIRYYLDPVFTSRIIAPIEIPRLDLTRGGRISATTGQAVKVGAAPIPSASSLNLSGIVPSKSVMQSFQDALKEKPSGSIDDYVKHGIGKLLECGALKCVPTASEAKENKPSGGGSNAVSGGVSSAANKELELAAMSQEVEEQMFGIGDDSAQDYSMS